MQLACVVVRQDVRVIEQVRLPAGHPIPDRVVLEPALIALAMVFVAVHRAGRVDHRRVCMIKLVSSPKPTKKELAELMQRCRERLGTEIQINLEFVDHIPRSKTGKFRAVISSVDTVGPDLRQNE